MRPLRVLVCGGRDYEDREHVFSVLDRLHARQPITLIIAGGARGADSFAKAWALTRGVLTSIKPADWARYGNRAGPVRNAEMLRDDKPHLVVAFPGGAGTRDSVAYRPFHYPWAVELDNEHERMHWLPEEVPLGDDVSEWKGGKMSEGEKDFITQNFRMFTQADVNVGGFYYDQLIPRFLNNEIRCMLGGFSNREKTHQRAYANLIDTVGLPESEYTAFLDYVEMKEKHDFMTQADSSTDEGLALALAKGVFNEGVSLFASFVMLLNFQRPEGGSKMKGMCKIVEWSIKDETKHVEGVVHLFRTLCTEKPEIVTDRLKHAIYDMAREVVRLERNFIRLAYGTTEIAGLAASDVETYIEFITDRRLVQLGLKPNFMVEKNPLPWLDWIVSAADHTNFFENKSAEYEKAGLEGGWGWESRPSAPVVERTFLVYTRAECGYCEKAKALLVERGLHYVAYDLTDFHQRHEFFEAHGFVGPEQTMPKIWVTEDGSTRFLGGHSELKTLLGA
jgi:glutaredoxin 3